MKMKWFLLPVIALAAVGVAVTSCDLTGGKGGGTISWNATANNPTSTSTNITFNFEKDPGSLAANDITVTPADAFTKGDLSVSGTTRTLAISAVKNSGNVTIKITKSGISDLSNPVYVYKSVDPDLVTWTATANNSETDDDGAIIATSDAIVFVFNHEVSITATNITIENGTGEATKGVLTPVHAPTVYSLAISGVKAGVVSVSITGKSEIDPGPQNVTVYEEGAEAPTGEAVEFKALSADGEKATTTTTTLTLSFDKAITGLGAADISINATSVTKGAFAGPETVTGGVTYTLAISGFTKGGRITVTIAEKDGYEISPASREVVISHASDTLWEDGNDDYAGTKLVVKVAGTNTDVAAADIHGQGGTISLIDGNVGFKYHSEGLNYEGTYAAFKLNLGTGKTLFDFKEVTFGFQGLTGDTGWKNLQLWANSTEITGSKNGDFAGEVGVHSAAPQYQGPTSLANMTISIDPRKAERVTGSTVYFVIFMPGGPQSGSPAPETAYRITNIEFVAHPSFIAVTDITGVPSVGFLNTPVDLTAAEAEPYNATNKTIAWEVTASSAAGVTTGGALGTGKFTATGAGSVTVKATITNGETASTPYTQTFSIPVLAALADDIAVTFGTGQTEVTKNGTAVIEYVTGGGYRYENDSNYNTFSHFPVNLGAAPLAAYKEVTFTVMLDGGDAGWKNVNMKITTNATGSYPGETGGQGTSVAGGVEKPLTFPITAEMAAITDNTVYITLCAHIPDKGDPPNDQPNFVTITNFKLVAWQ